MEVLHFHPEHGNFGDDLNTYLWPRIFKPDVWQVHDVLLVGIGTILNSDRINEEAVRSRRLFVLGSGAGYGPPPSAELMKRATFLAVRGPLTARLFDAQDKSATDGAALLAVFPDWRSSPDAKDILFIPHISSALTGHWEAACRVAEVTYLDPRSDVPTVLGAIRNAKLVLTEAMHGAILSDTLRVPWVPIATSPKILDFKWEDWVRSLGLAYAPRVIPHTRVRQKLAALKTCFQGNEKNRKDHQSESDAAVVERFRARHKSVPSTSKRQTRFRHVDIYLSSLDWMAVRIAGRALRKLKNAKPMLSSEATFRARVEQLQDSIWTFERTILG